MTSEVILESIIYLVVIIVLHKIIKIYLLNVEHLFDNKSLDTFTEGFDNGNNTTESWDELQPIQTPSNESSEYMEHYEQQNNQYMNSENYSEDPYVTSQEYNPEHYESQYESEEYDNREHMEHFTSDQIESQATIPEQTVSIEEPSENTEQNQEPNANRFEILNDRFNVNTYNNCGLSNNSLNYASLEDSELLSNNMSSLNEQFQIYSDKTENVEQPKQSFDSIMSKRNEEIQSYFESPNPQKMRMDIPNVKEANKEYVENINTNVIQNTNTNKYNNSLQYESLENTPQNNNQQNNNQQNDNQQMNVKDLESTSTNNFIELSDVRNKFTLEQNKQLSENVKQISAYDENSLAVI
tara:strand:+ start:949 stop:2010 length:1062 start_codon:yes stop_codon:yes gene_type:complete